MFPRMILLGSVILSLAVSVSCSESSKLSDLTQPAMSAPSAIVLKPDSTTLAAGDSLELKAVALDSNGATLIGAGLTWTVSDTTIARVSSSGVVTGLSPGTVVVSAEINRTRDSATIRVQAIHADIVAGDPADPSKDDTSAVLNLQQSQAAAGHPVTAAFAIYPKTANASLGATLHFSSVATWSDNQSRVAVVSYSTTSGSITQAGLYTAGTAPIAKVIATCSCGLADTATVSVRATMPTLKTLTLTPVNAVLRVGATQQFTVSGLWTDGSNAIPSVSYSATGGIISPGGEYTAGQTAGSFRVIATYQNALMSDTSLVTVVDTSPLPTGPSGQWRLVFADEFNGTTLDTGSWSTSYPWGNLKGTELEAYSPNEVTVAGGALHLTAHKQALDGKAYTSPE